MKRYDFKNGDKIGECIFLEDVEDHIHPSGEKRRRSKFKCKCGKEFITFLTYIKTGQSKGCGCARKNCKKKKGYKVKSSDGWWGTPEYGAWNSLIQRCYNTKDKRYHVYGALGIIVCDKWLNSFSNFINDVGRRPSAEYSIDRINVNGNYEPGNCRWATSKVQARNRKNSYYVTFRNESKALSEWAEILGYKYKILYQRIKRDKLSVEEALTKPV